MIPAAIERNYRKCLFKAGWWHMSLFQEPARGTMNSMPALKTWEPPVRED